MAFERRSYAGGAVETTITAGINATDLTIALTASTNWPLGGAAGPFHVMLFSGSTREKVEVASRTGLNLTIASVAKRGVDGTSATSWNAGAGIKIVFPAQDADEANAHVTDDARDDHSQYHNTARHAAVSHTLAMMGADSVGSAQIIADSVTASEIAPDTITAAEIAPGAVGNSEMGALAVATGNIQDNAVTNAKMADNAINTSEIVDAAVTAAKFQSSIMPVYINAADPGAVGANRMWFDSTARAIKVRNAANGAWETYVEAPTTAWVDWGSSITFTNVVIGTGGSASKHARYKRIGMTCIMVGGFTLGTGGGAGVFGTIQWNLPFPSNAVTGTQFHWLGGARAFDSGGGYWAGVGATDTTIGKQNFGTIATGGTAAWGPTVPQANWGANDNMQFFLMFEIETGS